MKAMKFRVKNEEHSKAIQERLFEMGYRWEYDGNGTLIPDGVKGIYAHTDGCLSFSILGDNFNNKPHLECTLDDLYSPIADDHIYKLETMAKEMLEAIEQLKKDKHGE